MTEASDSSVLEALHNALRLAETASDHGAEGAHIKVPSQGVALSIVRTSSDYRVTIWSTRGRQAAEDAPVQRVLAALVARAGGHATEAPPEDLDRVFLIPRNPAPSPDAPLANTPSATAPAPLAADGDASEQSFPASDPPPY